MQTKGITQVGRFFDTSKLRVGKHTFGNRRVHLNNLDPPWLFKPLLNDSVWKMLKDFLDFECVKSNPKKPLFNEILTQLYLFMS